MRARRLQATSRSKLQPLQPAEHLLPREVEIEPQTILDPSQAPAPSLSVVDLTLSTAREHLAIHGSLDLADLCPPKPTRVEEYLLSNGQTPPHGRVP